MAAEPIRVNPARALGLRLQTGFRKLPGNVRDTTEMKLAHAPIAKSTDLVDVDDVDICAHRSPPNLHYGNTSLETRKSKGQLWKDEQADADHHHPVSADSI